MAISVKFWGTRGSIPTGDGRFSQFGGDTSCISVETDHDLYIFDMGSGLRDLGTWMMQSPKKTAHIFISHLHLDHVLGFPFFQPIWSSETTLSLYCPRTENSGSPHHFFSNTLMAPPLFPVRLSALQANLTLIEATPGLLYQRDAPQKTKVTCFPLNHPGGCLGYRLCIDDWAFCYVSDHEHGNPDIDAALSSHVKGADIVVYDAAYTSDEYPFKKGWGHSTYEAGIGLCKPLGVKKLYLFHHDPSHDDTALEVIESSAKKMWDCVEVARQGTIIEVK
jgi:phosphoribosyl 1,2-cyclic phosphodiesterase